MLYNKSARALVIDLINADNPDLPFPINDTDFVIQDITAVDLDAQGRNTEARIIPRINSGYVGTVLVRYRRIDVGRLYAERWPQFDRYLESASDTLTTDDLLPALSQKFGILFEQGLWTNTSISPMSGSAYNNKVAGIRSNYNISPLADNPAFCGTLTLDYGFGKQEIADTFDVADVDPLRIVPDNNVLRPLADTSYDIYNKDFTDIRDLLESTTWNSFNGSGTDNIGTELWAGNPATTGANGTNVTTAWNWLRDTAMPAIATIAERALYIPNRNDLDMFTNPQDCLDLELSGFALQRYDLTTQHDLVPEANAELYNRVAVIRLHPATPWGSGDIYLHYNVVA